MFKRLLVLLALLLLSGPVLAQEPPLHDCDRLAANPADTQKVGPGVPWTALDAGPATNACERALRDYPGTTRFLYQLGRSFSKRNNPPKAVPLFRQAAERGHTLSQYNVGEAYFKGEGIAQNYAEAARWFLKAAEAGHLDAMHYLGHIYKRGWGVTADPKQSTAWFRRSAEGGQVGSQFNVGLAYFDGYGVPQDYAEAVKWYRMAAQRGDVDAQNNMGVAYWRGQGVAEDQTESLFWYMLAAKHGNKVAQTNLADIIDHAPADIRQTVERRVAQWRPEGGAPQPARNPATAEVPLNNCDRLAAHPDDPNKVGVGVPWDEINPTAAIAACTAAVHAHPGVARFQTQLARGYDEDGQMKNALDWYLKAAQQGYAHAQARVGTFYFFGEIVDVDLAEARSWFQKAAEKGHGDAAYRLSFLYANGKGVSKDYAEAAKWAKMAANTGHADAQVNLGYYYENGMGVGRNTQMARKLYNQAAEQGAVQAFLNLAALYRNGTGVAKDYVQAYMWYRLAADQGREVAQQNIDYLARQMSSTQIARATQQATAFTERLEARRAARKAETQVALQEATAPTAAKRLAEAPLDIVFPKGPSRPDDIAVVIGNADYGKLAKDIPNVRPAYADAASFKAYALTALGIRAGNLIDLRDATSAQMVRVFGAKDNYKGQLFDWVRPGRSRVYIYFAGHGAPAGQDGTPYLVPSDADATRIELNGYALATLYRNLTQLRAQSVTVVLEACFSGATPAGTVVPKASPIYLKAKTVDVPKGITVIAAGTTEQLASWDQDEAHGLFTTYYLKGMSGAADQGRTGNGDGTVTLEELRTYLNDTLTYYARRYYGRDQTAVIATGR